MFLFILVLLTGVLVMCSTLHCGAFLFFKLLMSGDESDQNWSAPIVALLTILITALELGFTVHMMVKVTTG